MKTVILVRHGESETNVQKVFTGQLDAALTEKGKMQAQLMAQYVDRYKVDKIYASSLQRAVDTAQPIAEKQGCPMEQTDAFREIYAGEWQGLSFDEIAEKYPQTHRVWRTDMGNAAPDGGETVAEFYARVTELFEEILLHRPEKTVCIVAHATPIRMIESYIRGGSPLLAKEIPWVPNASVTAYRYDGDFHCDVRGYCDFLGEIQTSLPIII